MFKNEVKTFPLWTWLLCAMSAPIAQLAGKDSWLSLGVIGLLCSLLCWCNIRLSENIVLKKWYIVLQILWLTVYLGWMLGWSAQCWPESNGIPVVPLTLLVLASAAAWNGASQASRVGSVVFWFMAFLYIIVAVAGVQNVQSDYLIPSYKIQTEATAVFLLPVVVSFLPGRKKWAGPILLLITGIGVGLSLLTVGTLSFSVSQHLENPFYEFSKSLSLFGVAERFEAFVSVALTMGYFCALSLLLSAAKHLSDSYRLGWGSTGVLVCSTVAAMLLLVDIPSIWIALFAAILWGLLPVIFACISREKNDEKPQKST